MSILISPLVTEKVSALNEKGKYGFVVASSANKIDIKNAVEKMYAVNVEKVNTIKVLGKSKVRFTKGGTVAGRRPGFKKAIVTLATGEVIDFYSNV
jgi:large subunit ribosomal protein L23